MKVSNDSTSQERLLQDFNERFLGYGCLKSRVWLIGPEQGGGKNPEELNARSHVWANRGRNEVEDLPGYHDELVAYHSEFTFNWRKSQPTWGPLIRIILGALYGRVREVSPREVSAFQQNEFCRSDSDNAILDVNALSSPGKGRWTQALQQEGFRTPKEWAAKFTWFRCALLRDRLKRYRPELVIFFPRKHESWVGTIVTEQFARSPKDERVQIARNESTLHAIVPHPSNANCTLGLRGNGAVNAFWTGVGNLLREELQNRGST